MFIGDDLLNSNIDLWGASISNSDNLIGALCYAPVVLPYGAFVTKVKAWFLESNSSYGLLSLWKHSYATNDDVVMTSLQMDQNSTAPQWSETTDIDPYFIDTQNAHYKLQIRLPADNAGESFEFLGAIIEYTVDSP